MYSKKYEKINFTKQKCLPFRDDEDFLREGFGLYALSICLSRCYRANNIRPEVHDKLFQCQAIT